VLEENLISSCLKGNRLAQFQLYQAYSKPMFNLCVRMMGNNHDAEDALQIAFTYVFLKLKSYRYEASLGSWIRKIVLNTCLNQIKRNKPSWIDLEEIEIEERTGNQEEINFNFKIIENCLLKLPDGYRVVLNLYLFEGYDHSEISQILGITESTSKSQYSRAKSKLKDLINQYHDRI
jgi:RNA polymerase sigma-70 factor (ECF subfamily)